ncbi:phosphate transport system regulatory protein PhoU [Clostridium fermenticellae]|uniref:Phosphate-specific transport system accessory protein PhoU n=1 Tax=Clostridium fermenticellae TaxID=2068654 RepID=A0A386H2R3_9CLOT|nr:phosphate signaling complex protein PhoU [Clostridium fermenticellae]AYD40001.1 phosphate transport system regulatory protein PhoU [Clostridium fermenticellae]
MTRTGFDSALEELNNDLIRMGNITEKQLRESVESLVNQDGELADKIIKNDDLVDDLQKEIENKCIRLIAKEQPLAKDLRNIFATSKIVTDIERMADYAVDIAKITQQLKNEKYIKNLIDIPKITQVIIEMIRICVDAYVYKDINEAYRACKLDDDVDKFYKSIFNEMLIIMADDKSKIREITQLLFACKYLERLGDHVTNVCEWTIYAVTGELKDLNE